MRSPLILHVPPSPPSGHIETRVGEVKMRTAKATLHNLLSETADCTLDSAHAVEVVSDQHFEVSGGKVHLPLLITSCLISK